MISRLRDLYRPAPAIEPLTPAAVEREYPRYRLQMMLSVFIGYATFYLVRNNFSLAKPYLMRVYHLSAAEVGMIAAAGTMAYGLSKFIMGNVSDRSNPRYFMATGLILSGVVNLIFGYLPSTTFMVIFWFANGWFQGMGWTPCARVLTHWFSDRERGTQFAIWNPAHNVGGGLAGPLSQLAMGLFVVFQAIFFFPAVVAITVGILLIVFLRDTPQSVGLPSIEEYKNDYPNTGVDDRERELGAREILFSYVFNNRFLWILALANVVVYIVRYGVLNWAPTYLCLPEGKGYSTGSSAWMFFLYEYAGIPGMLISGWISDKVFTGRRAPISVIFMLGVSVATAVYWLNPRGHMWIDCMALFAIGFLIYGPVMLIGVAAVDLVPKKAAGTAAGFTGLFGYIGATIAEVGIGKIVDRWGWNSAFVVIIVSALVATALLALTWNVHNRAESDHGAESPPPSSDHPVTAAV